MCTKYTILSYLKIHYHDLVFMETCGYETILEEINGPLHAIFL